MGEANPPPEGSFDKNLTEGTRFWRRNGLKPGTVAGYCWWIQRFGRYGSECGLNELSELTLAGVRKFAYRYARRRRIKQSLARESAHNALHAWSNALAALGVSVPTWKPVEPPAVVRVPIVREFLEYRRKHAGVSNATLRQDQSTSLEFLKFLRQRKRTCRTVRLADVEAFVARWRRRRGAVAVARQLCSVRTWLRFLHVSGRLRFDLAASVVGPVLKPHRHPPRALLWSEVRRILRVVDSSTRIGRRDYAILLLMSLYGLGGAEIIGLRLEDIDWDRKTLCVCRPKTQSAILLPLLPVAARALANYLQRSRPKPTEHRQVFLRANMPYRPFSGSTAIRYLLTQYGRRAGVTTGCLGSHVLRHSQATRQLDLGAPLKIVGDILGHRSPRSTSHYTRSAVRRLRDLALPLPHG
jgi:integrase/recombinase XerD